MAAAPDTVLVDAVRDRTASLIDYPAVCERQATVLRLQKSLRRIAGLKPSVRLAGEYLISELVFSGDRNPRTPRKIAAATIAAECGIGRDAANSAVVQLHELGYLGRSLPKTADGSTESWIWAGDRFTAPHELEPPERNHGGRRPQCKQCGSENVFTQRVCRDCGAVEVLTPPSDDDPGPPPDDDYVDSTSKNPHQKPERQIDGWPPPAESDVKYDDSPSVFSTGDDRRSDRGPATVVVDTPPADRTDLDAAATLLLDVAGDEPDHAGMQRGPETSKYGTIHKPLTLERVKAHLTGKHCFAIRLRGDTTRALAYEVDDRRGRGRLQSAAELLQLEGAKPLLIASPSVEHPGGACLWLFFSALVDAHAARHWAEHVAPILSTVAEAWPGRETHLRLPAGCYPGSTESRRVWRSPSPTAVPSVQASTPGGSSPAASRRLLGYKRRRRKQHPLNGARSMRPQTPAAAPPTPVFAPRPSGATCTTRRSRVPSNCHLIGMAKQKRRGETSRRPSVHIYGPDKFHDFGDKTKHGDRVELRAAIEGKSKQELFAEALAELKAA